MPFHADRQMDYGCRKLYKGGYLFLQSIYYGLGFDRICRKIRDRHKFQCDLNAILSDLVYTRILEPWQTCLLQDGNGLKWSHQENGKQNVKPQ